MDDRSQRRTSRRLGRGDDGQRRRETKDSDAASFRRRVSSLRLIRSSGSSHTLSVVSSVLEIGWELTKIALLAAA